jgi:hypothetical protein
MMFNVENCCWRRLFSLVLVGLKCGHVRLVGSCTHGALNFVFNSFVQFLIESFKFGSCYGADD